MSSSDPVQERSPQLLFVCAQVYRSMPRSTGIGRTGGKHKKKEEEEQQDGTPVTSKPAAKKRSRLEHPVVPPMAAQAKDSEGEDMGVIAKPKRKVHFPTRGMPRYRPDPLGSSWVPQSHKNKALIRFDRPQKHFDRLNTMAGVRDKKDRFALKAAKYGVRMAAYVANGCKGRDPDAGRWVDEWAETAGHRRWCPRNWCACGPRCAHAPPSYVGSGPWAVDGKDSWCPVWYMNDSGVGGDVYLGSGQRACA